MTGKFDIDGIDAYAQYGIFVTTNGYDQLVAFPPLKNVSSIDWQEEDGEEYDLSAPALNTREISLKFAAAGLQARPGAFIAVMSEGGAAHTFYFHDLERTYSLRLVSQSGLKSGKNLETFSLRFADDFPLPGYTYTAPASKAAREQGYAIDKRSLSEYGITLLTGTDAEIRKMPVVKSNLVRNIRTKHGAIYDQGTVTFKSKEVKLKCLMRSNTLSELWRNFDALLYDLIRPGERQFFAGCTGMNYPCYYKSSSVTRIYPTGKLWMEFDINLVFTSFRQIEAKI